MRLDHFVLFNNHLSNNTGGHMAQNTLSNSLSNNTGDTMSNNALTTPSITKSRGFGPSHSVWVNTMRSNGASKHTRVWGRIKDTGCNYIIEGWEVGVDVDETQWVRIPCANLATAQIHLVSVMDKLTFEMERPKNVRS